ncbi:TPA: hypothetical protein DIS57_04245 [Candidatus Wolfebacteria bacterium]|nr:hypothetical protein [Candidatus Wolfebacteria bacterium]
MVSGAIAIVLTLAANLDPGPMQSVWLGAIICIMMATISWWLGETAFKSARSCGILTPDPPKHSPKSFRNEVLNPDGTAL